MGSTPPLHELMPPIDPDDEPEYVAARYDADPVFREACRKYLENLLGPEWMAELQGKPKPSGR